MPLVEEERERTSTSPKTDIALSMTVRFVWNYFAVYRKLCAVNCTARQNLNGLDADFELNQSVPTQSTRHYYSSVWFNSVCLLCFCFWRWCQKQIISHHVRIASQTYTAARVQYSTAQRSKAEPSRASHAKTIEPLSMGVDLVPFCTIYSRHKVHVRVREPVCCTHYNTLYVVDRIKMHAPFVSKFSMCLLSFFVLVIDNQIVQGNWTMKRFKKKMKKTKVKLRRA